MVPIFLRLIYLHGHIFGKPTVLLEKAAACIASTVKTPCIGLRSKSSISNLITALDASSSSSVITGRKTTSPSISIVVSSPLLSIDAA